MLRALEQAGPQGLPTTRASQQVFNSRTYGWKILVQAQELGYIKREKKRRTNGLSGHPYTMNSLTDKGHDLLRQMGDVGQ
jgi:hypothetical protein